VRCRTPAEKAEHVEHAGRLGDLGSCDRLYAVINPTSL
jgi:hypothetical protein